MFEVRSGMWISILASSRWAPFPISVDSAELERQSKSDSVLRRARELKEELGNPEKILLGVDRLDYTKGIDLRLQALKELLGRGSSGSGEVHDGAARDAQS